MIIQFLKPELKPLFENWPKNHPDKNLNDPSLEVKFRRINEAYETLSDPDKKWIYDQKLERKRQKSYTSHSPDYVTSTPPNTVAESLPTKKGKTDTRPIKSPTPRGH